MRRIALLAVIGVAAALPWAAAVPAAPSSYVVRSDVQIGTFAVKRDGRLRGLVAAFGRPSSLRRSKLSGRICHAVWRPLGLHVVLYTLGARNPCGLRVARFGSATMRGPRWRTSVGLRIGDTVARLRRLYPRAKRVGSSWALVVRRSPFGVGSTYSAVTAATARGRVVALTVTYPAGGD